MTKKWLAFFVALELIAHPQTDHSLRTNAENVLQEALQDGNPNTRKQAVIALSLTASREPFLSQLESMLSDRDVQVRVATVASLVDLPNRRTSAALRRALNDQVPEASFSAAKALFELHDAAGKQALLSVLSGESKTSSNYFTDQVRDAMPMMHTPKTLFMFALRQGVGFAPVPGLGEGVASMQALLSDSGVSGRAAAALMLGRHKDEETLRALREALYDKDWSVRAAAIHSLALWNDPMLKPDLVALLHDDRKAVRLRAAAGYLRLDSLSNQATLPRRR